MEADPWFEQQNIDCVDMEGWALAYVAQQYSIKFRSFKYISDMADENAMEDWTTNIANGAELFTEKVRNGV
jgi:adenosylhomocysteine nucleosidase